MGSTQAALLAGRLRNGEFIINNANLHIDQLKNPITNIKGKLQ